MLYCRDLFEPGTPEAENILQHVVKLKWDEPNIGNDFVSQYAVSCKNLHTGEINTDMTKGNTCKLSIGGLHPNTKYEFTVQTMWNNGLKDPRSDACSIKTPCDMSLTKSQPMGGR